MSDTIDPGQCAGLIVAAHRSLEPVLATSLGAGPQIVDDAYAVQSAVMRELGPNGGFKTARPDPSQPNVMAPIPASRVRPSPAHFAKDEMRLVGIEIEIAFSIESELPALGQSDYDARLRQAVSVVPVIEMVDTRLADHETANDMIKLADNQFGFGLVTGAPVKDFARLNLTNPAITFTVNGEQLGPTSGQVPGSVDAFQVLKDFLEVVGDHCGGVQPGMYVTTGALSGLHWAKHGDEVAGSVAALGTVSVTVQG
jgi:2-keto-4-pentenoate hydratase